MPPMIGCLMGRFSQSSRDPAIDVFRASRPLSDTAFANTILKAGALSLAATWAVTVVTIAAILGVLDLLGDGGQAEMAWRMGKSVADGVGWSHMFLALAAVLIVSWTNMSVVTVAFLTGRNAVVGVLVLAPYGLAIGYALLHEVLPTSVTLGLLNAGAWATGPVAFLVTMTAFAAARRRRLISLERLAVSLMIWLGLVSIAAFKADALRTIAETGVALEKSVFVLGPGLLALSVAPLALAPLAVAWNRHR